MNIQIEELAQQVGIKVLGEAVYMFDRHHTLDSRVLEQFAQLIVGECAGIVQSYMSYWSEDHDLTKRIKEHFGVK